MTCGRVWIIGLNVLVGMVLAVGCKPARPPEPVAPSTPPLAEPSRKPMAPPTSGELPPGHPPIGEPAQTPVETGADGLPPGHPPIATPSVPATAASPSAAPFEAPIQFEGISLTPPANWQAVNPDGGRGSSGIAGPVAVFVLPRAEGDKDDAMLRLTHFPGMRNIPLEQNLNRWYGQLKQPEGRDVKDIAKQDTFELEGVSITLVDFTGALGAKEGYRMLAAQITHANGPHFMVVMGPEATVGQSREAVIEYLKSAKVTP